MVNAVITESQAAQIMGGRRALADLILDAMKMGSVSGELLLETGAKLKFRIDYGAESIAFFLSGYAADGRDVREVLRKHGLI